MKFSQGVKSMLGATFFFTVMNIFVKLIPHIPPVEIVLFRSFISGVICFYILRQQNISMLGKNKVLLIGRGIFGTLALVFYFTTLQHIPLASATLLIYLSPVITAVLASWLLGEKFYRIQWIFFLISFIGIGLIKNFDTRVSLNYLLLGMTACVLSSFGHICVRKLKTSEHPVVIVFYFPLVSLPIVGVLSWYTWTTPQGLDWIYLLAIGVLTQVSQVLMTRAFQLETAVTIAGVSYAGVLYAFVAGMIFFGELFNTMVLLGILLVIVGILLNMNVKRILQYKFK